MQRTTITLICDICQTDQDVHERTLTVNGKSVVAEVCNSDWPEDELDRILAHGRRPGTKPRNVSEPTAKKAAGKKTAAKKTAAKKTPAKRAAKRAST